MKKVILITGASSGIGKDTALSLIKHGHVVYGAARRLEMMQDIIQAGGHAIKMDILKDRNIDDVVNQIIKEQNRIDVLINNAGYGLWGAVETISIDEAKSTQDNMNRLKDIFEEHPGPSKIILHIRSNGEIAEVQVGNCTVDLGEKFIKSVENLLGENVVNLS